MKRFLLICLCVALLCSFMLPVTTLAADEEQINENKYEIIIQKSAVDVFDFSIKQTAGTDKISFVDVFIPATNMPETLTFSSEGDSAVFAQKVTGGFRILRSLEDNLLSVSDEPTCVLKVTLSSNSVVSAPTSQQIKDNRSGISNRGYVDEAQFSVTVCKAEKLMLANDTAVYTSVTKTAEYPIDSSFHVNDWTKIQVWSDTKATNEISKSVVTASFDKGKLVLSFSSAPKDAAVYYITLDDGTGKSEPVLVHMNILKDDGSMLVAGDNITSYKRILAKYNENGAMESVVFLSAAHKTVSFTDGYSYKFFTLDESFAPIFDVLEGKIAK